jgi:two-component system CheB/CheR fusion protein
LTLHGRKLVLAPRPTDRTQHSPIDIFFRSLAQELGDAAIVVILSGAGSDGVEGVHAIRAVGGTVLVQDPDTAKHDGMPRAAIATGKADAVLPPAQLAEEAVRLARLQSRPTIAYRPPGQELVLTRPDLDRIFALLRNACGVDFNQYKLPTIQRRIHRRMMLGRMTSVDQYAHYLQEHPAEVSRLYQDLLIHVTRFFREPESFAVLTEIVFPQLLEGRSSDATLRIWVPACSTGEEPYSVAMALLEVLDARGRNNPVQVFATDISETAIEQARAGVYPPSIADELSPDRLRRFFTRTDGNYRIDKSVRDVCVFARQDLTRDPPFSKLDLIICRNVLIYLGQTVQSRLINVFHYALNATGYLVLGSAETIGPHEDLFAVVDKKYRVFRKKGADSGRDVHFALPFSRPAQRGAREGDDPRGASGIQGEVNRVILDRYSPPGVIVNDDLRIVRFLGQTGRFLEPASGDASLNLLKMCREGLLHGLRTALQNAKKIDAPVRRDGLRVKTNHHYVSVAIEVLPLMPTAEGRHFLILFQDVGVAEPPPLRVVREKPAKRSASETQQELERLQRELVASREHMQSIIQDLEAANEELQSANEEILSSNEELQSTNEELDTAKEELQSTNEELNTVNEELRARNEELARINSDLINVLNGVQMAVVIVSGDLRIRRFTPLAEKLLNLIAGDVGRPINQIKPNITIPDLERLIVKVIDAMTVEQREVQDLEGRTYSLSIRPYKDVNQRIDGAVIMLLDIDDLRRHEFQAREAREYAEAVLGAVRHPLVVLDGELRVKSVNPAFLKLFKLQTPLVEEKPFFEIDGAGWNTPALRAALHEVLHTKRDLDNAEFDHNFPGVGQKRLRITTRGIDNSGQRLGWILMEIVDVTTPNSTWSAKA